LYTGMITLSLMMSQPASPSHTQMMATL